jgi:hypothetical protein
VALGAAVKLAASGARSSELGAAVAYQERLPTWSKGMFVITTYFNPASDSTFDTYALGSCASNHARMAPRSRAATSFPSPTACKVVSTPRQASESGDRSTKSA